MKLDTYVSLKENDFLKNLNRFIPPQKYESSNGKIRLNLQTYTKDWAWYSVTLLVSPSIYDKLISAAPEEIMDKENSTYFYGKVLSNPDVYKYRSKKPLKGGLPYKGGEYNSGEADGLANSLHIPMIDLSLAKSMNQGGYAHFAMPKKVALPILTKDFPELDIKLTNGAYIEVKQK